MLCQLYVQESIAFGRRPKYKEFLIAPSMINLKTNIRPKLKPGSSTALNNEEEQHLVEGLLECAKWGFPLRGCEIGNIVQGYLNRTGRVEKRFKENRPGSEWLKGFLSRNRELTVRCSEKTKRYRAAVRRETMKHGPWKEYPHQI